MSWIGKLNAEPRNSVVKPGSTVNLQWDFDDDIKTVTARTWRFFGDSGSRILALISVDAKPIIRDQSLKFEIKKPATLILKDVNESYNGTYQFTLETDDMKYVSEAVVEIASKLHYFSMQGASSKKFTDLHIWCESHALSSLGSYAVIFCDKSLYHYIQ